jgi:hypothetical protein
VLFGSKPKMNFSWILFLALTTFEERFLLYLMDKNKTVILFQNLTNVPDL